MARIEFKAKNIIIINLLFMCIFVCLINTNVLLLSEKINLLTPNNHLIGFFGFIYLYYRYQ